MVAFSEGVAFAPKERITILLIRPRLTDYHGITLAQEDADFAIPFFDEDIPLYVDPFLMWRSPSQQDIALHGALLTAFNYLGQLACNGEEDKAVKALIAASECDEVGLGSSTTRRGKRIGRGKAEEILAIFRRTPRYGTHGLGHIEELQFFVEGISKDRISDFACSSLKSFLIDFTIDQCKRLGIPITPKTVPNVWDPRTRSFISVSASLPIDPTDDRPLLLVPIVAAEFADPDHPARKVVRRHKARMAVRLKKICGQLDAATAELRAQQIALLFDGALASDDRLRGPGSSGILKDAVARSVGTLADRVE